MYQGTSKQHSSWESPVRNNCSLDWPNHSSHSRTPQDNTKHYPRRRWFPGIWLISMKSVISIKWKNSRIKILIYTHFQVLCIGLGTPLPTVSLYLDGHLVRSDKKRHLVTTVFNASRVLQKVGCSASNGMVCYRYHIRRYFMRFLFHRIFMPFVKVFKIWPLYFRVMLITLKND